jgi:Zn-dependent oligopeptidase
MRAYSCAQVLTHAKNRALREELYRANITRASSDKLDNSPIIEQVSRSSQFYLYISVIGMVWYGMAWRKP